MRIFDSSRILRAYCKCCTLRCIPSSSARAPAAAFVRLLLLRLYFICWEPDEVCCYAGLLFMWLSWQPLYIIAKHISFCLQFAGSISHNHHSVELKQTIRRKRGHHFLRQHFVVICTNTQHTHYIKPSQATREINRLKHNQHIAE